MEGNYREKVKGGNGLLAQILGGGGIIGPTELAH